MFNNVLNCCSTQNRGVPGEVIGYAKGLKNSKVPEPELEDDELVPELVREEGVSEHDAR